MDCDEVAEGFALIIGLEFYTTKTSNLPPLSVAERVSFRASGPLGPTPAPGAPGGPERRFEIAGELRSIHDQRGLDALA
jgi:hypothetical protein